MFGGGDVSGGGGILRVGLCGGGGGERYSIYS